MSIRDLLVRRSATPAVLPRLTRAKTVEVMARETGDDLSKIEARLDKQDRQRLGKRAQANRNPLGSLEHAVRYAMEKLGRARVAEILGVGEATLYKACNPNAVGRYLPDIGMGKVLGLVKALKSAGHTEFFSVVLSAAGDDAAAVEHLPTIHHALTAATLAHGDVARSLALATEDGEDISPAAAARIIDAISASVEAHQRLQSQVLLAAKTKENAS